MSFSPEWLALREPVDHRSLSADLRAQVAAYFASASPVRVMDMGCGSGSNLRALADHLGNAQHWTLVDWDENLLAHARDALAQWGEGARDEDGALVIQRGNKRIEVLFERADLARHVAHALERPLDLVTAAAFFDLVSEDWMDGFSAALAERSTPLYTTLTYNGVEQWSPRHAADGAMREAFHAHQHSDKGFGPAAGPDAADALARSLTRQGYRVARASSPWLLTSIDARLIDELARGAANAVRETGLVAEADVGSWLAARAQATGCEVGHTDIFAVKV
ncbi:MAG: class I SAM-dependent methyltransferase [Beijerinckiaceae bacterium]|nr:class I SAM-dependent methyltransferase [Beijerinckiaceae bacterium]